MYTDVAVAVVRRIPAIRQPDASRKISVIPEPAAALRPRILPPNLTPRPWTRTESCGRRETEFLSKSVYCVRGVHFVLPYGEFAISGLADTLSDTLTRGRGCNKRTRLDQIA